MLKSTFIHIPGIGRKSEVALWKHNIRTWDDFIQNSCSLDMPESTISNIQWYLQKSLHEYDKKNHSFFREMLPIQDHWRVYRNFSCCFLDIETTGLSRERNKITTIAVSDGAESKIFIRGKNLDEFQEYISNYSTMVTFNGRCFDIPFIQHNFPEIAFNQFHIDLRFVMRDLGFTGGLKRIEKLLGIKRNENIASVDGYEAVRLWKRYERGDDEALQTLVKYNLADAVNLKSLMDMAFTKKSEQLQKFFPDAYNPM